MVAIDFSMNDTIGPAFIGVNLSTILYSCTCAQSVYYARNYPNDRWVLKAFILFLWMIDTAVMMLDAQCLYTYVVEYHADLIAILAFPVLLAWYFVQVVAHSQPSPYKAEYVLGACASFVVQCYFIHKIWHLLGSKWYRYPLTISGYVLAFVSFGGAGGVSYVLAHSDIWTTALGAARSPAFLQRVTNIAADLYITLLLCLTLRGSKSDLQQTNRLLNKLIVYTVNRGILTSAIQICHFVIYASTIDKSDLVWTVFYEIGNKISVNSVLAVLNVRQHLRTTYPPQNGTQTFQTFADRSRA